MLMEFTRNEVTIQFDDFTFDADDQIFWAEMCKDHSETYKSILGERLTEGTPYAPCCSVRNCKNAPEIYVGFKKKDVQVYEGELLNQTGTMVGKITHHSTRYCAACCSVRPCYIVRWPDGSITKPCTHGCGPAKDGSNREQIQ